jgi:hypothetical protein
MRHRYGVLCSLLFFIVLILGYENYSAWSPPELPGAKREPGRKVEGKTEASSGVTASEENTPLEAFNVIGEKNIFNPDRKEFSIAAAGMASGMAGKPVTRPQIALYGVVLGEGYQSATIINPGRTLVKGERETKTIRVGESVGSYKVAKILPDRIVMEGGEDSFEVLLYDPRSPKRRVEVRTPTTPATVTSTTLSANPSAPPPGVPQLTPPAVVAPAPPVPGLTPPAAAVPTSAPPFPVPRASGTLPEGISQTPGQSVAPSTPPPVPDPGLWRGRRPISPLPAGPPG